MRKCEKKCHGDGLVKLLQRERLSSNMTTNDVCTHPHGMWGHECNFAPNLRATTEWSRDTQALLQGAARHQVSTKYTSKTAIPTDQTACLSHPKGEEGTRVCGVAHRFPFSVFRFPVSVSGFRFPVSVSGFRFRFPVSGFRYPIPPLHS